MLRLRRTSLTVLHSSCTNSRVTSIRSGTRAKKRLIYVLLSKLIEMSSYARLALVQAVMSVLASGLAILGVAAPDEMR